MATRLRRSFIAKMSSMLFIAKSFFQLSDQRVPQAGESASVKHRSEITSGRSVQVSLLGPAHQDRLGKIGKFPRVRICLGALAIAVLGPASASAQDLGIKDAMVAYRTRLGIERCMLGVVRILLPEGYSGAVQFLYLWRLPLLQRLL